MLNEDSFFMKDAFNFSDAFDFEFGVGILRMPERMYQESEDIVEDDPLNQQDEENNYDGMYMTYGKCP